MSSKARELSKFSFDIHVNEGAGTLGIGTTADVGDRLYVEGGAQVTGVSSFHNVIHAQDKIGIGLNNPDTKLHISGTSTHDSIWMSGPVKRKNTIGINNSDNLVLAADEDAEGSSSSMRFRVDGEEQVRLQGGKVGIGTELPGTKLHVFGGTTNDQVVTIESTSSSGIGAPDLSLFTNDPAIQNGETIGVLRFDCYNSSGSPIEYSRLTTTIIDNGSGGNASAKVVVQARRNNTTVDTVAEFNGSTGDAKIAAQNGAGIILAAPNGTLYKITVTNAGAINVASA